MKEKIMRLLILVVIMCLLIPVGGAVLSNAQTNSSVDPSSTAKPKQTTKKITITAKIGDSKMFINGKEITLDVPAQKVNDRTMLPLRAIFEALGATVTWDGESQSITGVKGSVTIKMTVGKNVIDINGRDVEIDVAPMLVDGRTLVPVRAVAESFNADVSWNEETSTATITYTELVTNDDQFEDKDRTQKVEDNEHISKTSPYCHLIYYKSTVTPDTALAMKITLPKNPSYILARTHGWHMSMPAYKPMENPDPNVNYVTIDVDMRGRAYSQGKQDCSGWELYDVIDAINYVRDNYKEYIIDPNLVYFDGGSGGGGNAFALAGKFPDFFAAISVSSGMSDYALWYENDKVGEFKDDMEPWIGSTPSTNRMAYDSRSGLTTIGNLFTPMAIVHGETDIRVPVEHARKYVTKAKEIGKDSLITYLELDGVGDNAHYGKEKPDQTAARIKLVSDIKANNKKEITIPDKGTMTVAGYLVTKKFKIVLDSIDKVATVEYDINADTFIVKSTVGCKYEAKNFVKNTTMSGEALK